MSALLLQVLSVQTALSIQSHPDKKLAEKLHAQQPQVCRSMSCRTSQQFAVCRTSLLLGVIPAALLLLQELHSLERFRQGSPHYMTSCGCTQHFWVNVQLLWWFWQCRHQCAPARLEQYRSSLPNSPHAHRVHWLLVLCCTCCCHPRLVCWQDYKDDNHKPEMALALEDFEALCGFVSNAELKQQLQQQPELRLCVGEEAASAFLEAEEEQAKPVSGKTALTQQNWCQQRSWQLVALSELMA